METLQFNSEQDKPRTINNNTGPIIGLLEKLGLASSTAAANAILIALIIIMFGLSAYFFIHGF